MEKENNFYLDIFDLGTNQVTSLESKVPNLVGWDIGFYSFNDENIYLWANKNQTQQLFKIDTSFNATVIYKSEAPQNNFLVQAEGEDAIFLLQDVDKTPQTVWLNETGRLIQTIPHATTLVKSTKQSGFLMTALWGKVTDKVLFQLSRNAPLKQQSISDFLGGHLFNQTEVFSTFLYDTLHQKYLVITNEQLLILNQDKQKIGGLGKELFETYPNIIFHQPIFDKQGNIWLATVQNGLFFIAQEKKLVKSATFKGGDYQILERSFTFDEPLPTDSSLVWLGNQNLYSINAATNKFTRWTPKAPYKIVRCFTASPTTLDLLVENETTTSLSVFSLQKTTRSWQQTQLSPTGANNVIPTAFFKDSKANFWIGTKGRGIYKVEQTQQFFLQGNSTFSAIDNALVHFFVETAEGIFIATETAIFLYQPDQGIVQEFSAIKPTEPSISPKPLHVLAMPEGTLWVASYGYGFGKLEYQRKEFTVFNHYSNGKIGIANFSIADKRQNIWISSRNGLFKLNTQKERISKVEQTAVLHNTYVDAAAMGADGQIFFASNYGIISFHPNDFQGTTRTSFKVTDCQVLDIETGMYQSKLREFQQQQQVIIEPHQSIVRLDLALLDYAQPDKHHFRYKISSLNKDWVALEGNQLLLAGLPYGKYQLTFQVENELGQEAAKALDFPLHVLKPFYAQWWFIVLLFCTSFLLLYVLFKWRNRQL
ncbi:MAG: triple tyrosine motif-containing protein, partial [Bacteroidota bacterium]